MSTFVQTINPTPYGYFDSDATFQSEADSVVTWIKRRLGDDILSVELTKKQIWASLEEATLEYSRLIQEMQITSDLVNVLGVPTGSVNLTNKYLHNSLESLLRLAAPYGSLAGVGGNYNANMAYFDIEEGRQDYNLYTELKNYPSGSLVYPSLPSGSHGKIRILEVMHYEPLAAQQNLLNASNITNFLATNFNYESYVNSTVFYVLPVFEDILRKSMLETAFRVRRSHYSYSIIGQNLRIHPIPTGLYPYSALKLFIRYTLAQSPIHIDLGNGVNQVSGSVDGINGADSSMFGVSGPSNMPLSVIPYNTINAPGRQWVRQYCLAIATEILGLVRSKFENIPIPNSELRLNGEKLVSQGREDKQKLVEQLKGFLENLTKTKMIENQVATAEAMMKQLRMIPIPLGKSIIIG